MYLAQFYDNYVIKEDYCEKLHEDISWLIIFNNKPTKETMTILVALLIGI